MQCCPVYSIVAVGHRLRSVREILVARGYPHRPVPAHAPATGYVTPCCERIIVGSRPVGSVVRVCERCRIASSATHVYLTVPLHAIRILREEFGGDTSRPVGSVVAVCEVRGGATA